MNRYHVKTAKGLAILDGISSGTVDADYLEVQGGSLVFYQDDRNPQGEEISRLILALAPGTWTSCWEEKAGKAALRSVR